MSLRIRLQKLEEKARTDGRTPFEIWFNNNGILTQTRTGEQLSREEFQQRYPDARSIELKWNLGGSNEHPE